MLLNICAPVLAENAEDYNNKGVGYLDAGDFDQAIGYLENAHSLAPDNKVITKNLANAYAGLAYQFGEKGNWLPSINYGEKALLLDSTDIQIAKNLAVSYNNYGFTHMKNGDFEAARDNFDKALKLDDQNFSVYVNMGNLMYQQGKMEEAVIYWQKALALHPDLPDVRDKVASLEKENKVDEKFNHQEYSHFEVKYEGYERQDLANKVSGMLNTAYYRIGTDFNYYPREQVTVIIYTQGQYGEVTGNPNWLPGESEGGGIIRVTADDIGKSDERLENVLYHEYTHTLLFRKIGGKIPRWLDEGLAQYKAPNGGERLYGQELILLKKRMVGKNLIPLDKLENSWNNSGDQETVSLAYVESKSIILYLVDRYGSYQVLALLDKFKDSQDMNGALKDVFYIDPEQFEQNWLAWLKGKY